MKPESKELCESFKAHYNDLIEAKAIKEAAEAFALGVDQSSVNHYQNPASERNLPLALATKSKVREDIAAWFAEQCGGFFVKACGKLNGKSSDELCEILKASAKLQVETDPKKRELLFRTIEKNAAKGIKEEGLS